MTYIIIQYVLVTLLVVGVGYLLYLLREKDPKFKEDYFGITYSILSSIDDKEGTAENVKKILRAVSEIVLYVENNYKNEDNKVKEDKAVQFSKEALKELRLRKTIDDDSIRYIIRLSAALLPPTNKQAINTTEEQKD